MLRYSKLSQARKGQLLFRGQNDASWPLKATLDRARTFSDDVQRLHLVNALLDEFGREAIVVKWASDFLPEDDAMELLARHHGLSSPLLDRTQSPYIASYFAYGNNRGKQCAGLGAGQGATTQRRQVPG